MARVVSTSQTRRRLLGALASLPIALALAPTARAGGAPRRLLVLVYLHGGNDGYNTWVPYTDPLYYQVRPTIAVARDSVLKVTETHGFHPSLEPLIPTWRSRELAIVQGIGYPLGTQQHYRDSEIAFTAEDGELLAQGWAGRALASRARTGSAPDAVAFDVLDIREADPMGPFRGERAGVVQVHYASELLAKHRVADCVITTNTHGRAELGGLAAELGTPALRTRFPEDPFGQAMHAAVELAAAQPSLPAIHVTLNGLDGDKHHSVDTHWDQLKYHGNALARLAAGLAALRAGLVEIGRWDETIVATYDEFGRSPIENGDHGTHHGLSNTHFVMGGRVNGGLYGEPQPVQKIWPIGGPAPAVDTRSLWSTLASQWWGVAPADVFARAWPTLPVLRA
jgi:uncharacterized protein (DUF1501 family)